MHFMCLFCVIQIFRIKLSKKEKYNVLKVEIRDSINRVPSDENLEQNNRSIELHLRLIKDARQERQVIK